MKPVESLKEFGMHLLIVILGILIALSLEGLLEWRHHRELTEKAGVYQLQEEYLRLQARTEDAVVAALPAFAEQKDVSNLPRTDMEAEKSAILTSLSALTAQSQIGEVLSKTYQDTLK